MQNRLMAAFALAALVGCGTSTEVESVRNGIPFVNVTTDAFAAGGASAEAPSGFAAAQAEINTGVSGYAPVTIAGAPFNARWLRYDTHDYLLVKDRASQRELFQGRPDQSELLLANAGSVIGCTARDVAVRRVSGTLPGDYIISMDCP